MRRALLPAALVVLALAAGSASSSSADFELGAQLDWRQQVPRPVHPQRRAAGSLTGDLDHQARMVDWKLVYAKLSGRATSAHLHLGRRGVRGKAVLTLCSRTARRCRSGMTGTARVSAATVRALEAGLGYVDVHTRRNPAGEIRGQISVKR
jgi:hypothetical protein